MLANIECMLSCDVTHFMLAYSEGPLGVFKTRFFYKLEIEAHWDSGDKREQKLCFTYEIRRALYTVKKNKTSYLDFRD